jgi:heme-degrading monooxygenase HmoA
LIVRDVARYVDGMVITVFRSRIRPENADDFHELADRMMMLAEAMPGFVSYKVYESDDGERCSVIEFETPEHLQAWRAHPEHVLAQKIGRERFYAQYTSFVGEPLRISRFEH